MISRLSCLILTAALLLSAPVAVTPAYAQNIKDSIDYTLDDGIMSKEEMEMEANDFYGQCMRNAYQQIYFKCECLAGAFLQQREKLGPMVVQADIFRTITNSAQTNARCANTEAVALRVYQSCVHYTANYDRTELLNNDEYCSCAGNKAAIEFSKEPRLSASYFQSIRVRAMTDCKKPEVQQQYASRPRTATPEEPAGEAAPVATTPAAEAGQITGESSLPKSQN